MSKYFNTLGLAALLGLGTLGLASASASAAAIPLFPDHGSTSASKYVELDAECLK